MRRAALGLVACGLLAPAAEAGPWATGKGHFYVKATYQAIRADELAAPDGTIFPIPDFRMNDVYLYGALGISDSLDLIASIPLVRSSDLEDFGSETGFGDVQVKLQHQFARRGAWVFAARGTLQFPTGDETRAEGILPTGSGVYEGSLVLGAGRSFGAGGRFYAYLEAGPQLRGGGLRDGFQYEAQLGWNASRRLVLALNLRGVEPWSKAPREVAIGSPVGVSDRVTFVAAGPSATLKLSDLVALQLDVEGLFHTRNIAKGPTLRLGLALSR